jgi:hypothetical protein
VAVAWLGATALCAEEPYGLPLHGAAAESFLRTAKVLSSRTLGEGVSASKQVTLSDGTSTHRAIFKTIDTLRRGASSFPGAGVLLVDYEDSYRFEIAAYELDKLLGFDLVPPTVERSIGHRTGSLQLWVERATSEGERRKRGLHAPDREAWNLQIHTVRLLHQLTFNWDAQNIQNVLFDPSFKVYAVDFSRSFAAYDKLRSEELLVRFPRAGLEAMKRLDEATLDARLGRFVTRAQVRTLLKRRDLILALAARRVEEKGEAAVLY